MCGIAGCFGSNPPDPDLVNKTLGLMKNRGPNNTDYVTFKNSEFFAGFLHSRLSIIDLDERSNQPFQIDDVTLVHNGEIYNYVELRKELEKDGVVFQTDSDTEVLLQSYLKWGEECVDHFEGMWAFAIYDVRDRKIFISRDRFGEKPLFYSDIAGTIYFASETKFIRSLSGTSLNVCTDQILRYLVNGYKSLYKHGQTFFDGVNELPPAHNMRITKDGGVEVYRYWTPTYHPKKMSLDEAIEGVRHHLKESVKLRLRSDVPLAFCLSGGIDSTSIISIAVKEFGYDVATFSIVDQDERYNETDNMNAVINDLGCKNTMIDVPNTGFLDRMEFLIDYHDSPLATISYYVHAYLSEAIAESGFKVAVSGTAADELLTGYYDHHNLHLNEMKDHADFPQLLTDWKANTGSFVRNPYLANPELYFEDPTIRDHIYLNNDVFAGLLKVPFSEGFIEENYTPNLLRNRMLNELFHEAIPVILHEDDLNSMCFSIENRSPYLDRALYDFSYSIPPEHLMKDGFAKYTLRMAMEGILTDKVRLDRRKKGFNASFQSVIDLKDDKNIDYLLDGEKIFELVDRDKMRDVFKMDPLPNSYSKFLFNFVNAKIFMDKHA